MRAAERLDIDTLGSGNDVALLHREHNFIGVALLFARFWLALHGFLELSLLDGTGSLLKLEQFVSNILDVTTLSTTAHEYSFILSAVYRHVSEPSLQKDLAEEVEAHHLVFLGDI